MRTIAAYLTIAFLFLLTARPTFGEMDIGPLSKKTAQEWGVNLTVTESGPNHAWVELSFAPTGKLDHFDHVSLEVQEGGKLMIGYCALKEARRDGKIVVHFMCSREILDKITLRIVTGYPMNFSGHDMSVKEFLPVVPVK